MKTISLATNMKQFIKALCITLVLVCVFSLSACKPQTSDPEQTQATGQTAAPTPTGIDLEEDVLPNVTPTVAPTGSTGNTQAPSTTTKAPQGSTPTAPVVSGQTPTPSAAPTQAPTNAPTQSPNVQLPFDPFI